MRKTPAKAAPSVRGRPSRTSQFVVSRLIAASAAGYTPAAAAVAAGVDRTTLYRWRKRSEREISRLRVLDPDVDDKVSEAIFGDMEDLLDGSIRYSPKHSAWSRRRPSVVRESEWQYLVLVHLVDRARAQFEAELVQTVNRAAKKEWRAAVWMLERVNPEHWGRRKQISVRPTVTDHGLTSGVPTIQSLLEQVERVRAQESLSAQ
jgi:hypothetical protein